MEALSQVWRNFCVSDTYEPGSPAKVLTVAAGLEENIFQTTSYFECDGLEEIGGHKIKCTAYQKGGHGELTVEESLIVSCNDAMMHMAAMEGKAIFKKYQDMFNLGEQDRHRSSRGSQRRLPGLPGEQHGRNQPGHQRIRTEF